MVWQMLAAGVIGSLFYLRRVVAGIRHYSTFVSERRLGYVFALLFALVASPLTVALFNGGQPLPRFNDLFLIGIVLTVYLFSWQPAVLLLVIASGVSAWILPPYGSLRIAGLAEWCRLLSFAGVSLFLICLITRMKRRGVRSEEGATGPLRMQSAAVGAN
jgi:hypothetical protein